MNEHTKNEFIKEICAEKGIQIECLSFDYITRLTKNGVHRHIFGAFWDLNSAAADRIACDKTACALILNNAAIPAVPHELVFNPLRRIGRKDGEWAYALQLFEKYSNKVVVKPNQGSMGQDVFLCQSPPELETALHTIFKNHPDAAISPFVEIKNEYRVFCLNGKSLFSYGKTSGNSWQHNLSQGASAFELCSEEKNREMLNLAVRAANCIGITFATVDIAESPSGKLSVMEINSGVQAAQLLEQLPHLRPAIKDIFAQAVELMASWY
ncbi:MAG: hypothetical protein FWB96_05525 [Defluviitaleaceae bacterium]|nr:hypothetical protein [Defluviitaleaceae bacterium]MCL2262247.1 hypothetical protein [Defluviitaleaceae bacterium]